MEDSLLIKYLLEEASPDEVTAVEIWMDANPEHKKHFQQLRWVWVKSKDLVQADDINENSAWERFQLLREENQKKVQPKGGQRFLASGWGRVAAAFVLLGAITAIVLSFLPHSGKALYSNVALVADQEAIKEVLIDGSVLTLNKNAKLSYSQKWLGGNRLVKLEQGEAYFQVEKNPKKPFVIAVGELEVRVLGTSFNVKKTKERTIVIVDEGVVQVKTVRDEVLLQKNEKAMINNDNGTIEKSASTDQLFKYYVSKEFVAKNLKLTTLVEALNAAYNSEVEVLSSQAKEMSITTTLPYGSLRDNLEIISQTLGVTVSQKGDNIIIE
ncbi:FecR domain-containing protein [Cyclobacterium qasimii]|uniref:Anti-FecI sigma factor, FecR n=2 Tax=Cyclobacterium qasimii TaxID=1350429 RepID=S7WEG7_9BACT|nr:FecR domain-containing protein [Cyclobacterium qasimii]EPR65169.1 anti-FecI sigma factor, FecR [Cyclobacterium qasimii M12-11B]GEO22012.1 anti-sigma factor [Cyclobacterium qasimii]